MPIRRLSQSDFDRSAFRGRRRMACEAKHNEVRPKRPCVFSNVPRGSRSTGDLKSPKERRTPLDAHATNQAKCLSYIFCFDAKWNPMLVVFI